MDLSEQELKLQRAQAGAHQRAAARRGRIESHLLDHPRSRARVLAVIVRSEMTPLMALPFLVGSVVAWWETGRFNPMSLGFGLIGVVASSWAYFALSDAAAHQYDRGSAARAVQDPYATGFSLIRSGHVPVTFLRDLGLLLLAIHLAAVLWVTMLAGWPILFFFGSSILTAAAVMLLPFVPGYRGWGIGQAGVMLAFGPLPALAGYYGQAQELTWLALWAALPMAFIVGVAHLAYDAIHIRRDWLISKPTLAVNLGPVRARDLATALTLAVYVAALAAVILTDLPMIVLVVLISLPMALGAFAPLQREEISPDDRIHLYAAALNAGLLTGLLCCAALIVDKLN